MVTLKNQIRWCVKAQLLLGGLLLLVAASFYFLGYRPNSRRELAMSAEIAGMRQELIDNTGRSRILPQVTQEVKNLHLRADSAKKMSKNADTGVFAKDVERIKRNAHLTNLDFQTPDPPQRMELFYKMPVQYHVQGNFVNVSTFLRDVESLPRLVRIRSIDIKADPTAKELGDVTVNLNIDLYYQPDMQ